MGGDVQAAVIADEAAVSDPLDAPRGRNASLHRNEEVPCPALPRRLRAQSPANRGQLLLAPRVGVEPLGAARHAEPLDLHGSTTDAHEPLQYAGLPRRLGVNEAKAVAARVFLDI